VYGQKIDSQLRRPFHGGFDGFFDIEVLVIKKDPLALPDQALRKTVAAGKLEAKSNFVKRNLVA
jgi:hypothetical protein